VVQEVVECAKNKRLNTDNITVILVALNRGIEGKKNVNGNQLEQTGLNFQCQVVSPN